MPYLSIRKPNTEPRIKVIAQIGINNDGSFHPISIADGNKIRKGIIIPFAILFILIFVVAIKNPDTIQRDNAERLASHVNFWRTIGTISITPAMIPSKIPSWVFFIVIIKTMPFASLKAQNGMKPFAFELILF